MKVISFAGLLAVLPALGLALSLDAHDAPPASGEMKKIEATVTPSENYRLPDGITEILALTETVYENRKHSGVILLKRKDLTLDIVPNTVVASGGYLFHLTTPHECQLGHVREEDMIFTVLDSCKTMVMVEEGKTPVLQLKALKGSLAFEAKHSACNQLGSVRGEGKHFVAIKISRTEIYRKHPSPVLGTGMDVTIVNNFGAKSIRLEYMQKETVTIGPETITVESYNFDYDAKSVKVRVATTPKTTEAEALIVEYGEKPAANEPAADLQIKQNGAWEPAELPLPGLAEGKAVEVRVRGTLNHGIMAIGGETTGTIIRFGKTTWELDLRKNPALRPTAEKLNGKRVTATGVVREKAGVEIAKRTIVTVESLVAADK